MYLLRRTIFFVSLDWLPCHPPCPCPCYIEKRKTTRAAARRMGRGKVMSQFQRQQKSLSQNLRTFKEPRNRFRQAGNRFLGSLKVYKDGIWSFLPWLKEIFLVKVLPQHGLQRDSTQ
jgi:hypothetical protein